MFRLCVNKEMGVYLTSADDVVKGGDRGSGDRRGGWSVRYRQRQGEGKDKER